MKKLDEARENHEYAKILLIYRLIPRKGTKTSTNIINVRCENTLYLF